MSDKIEITGLLYHYRIQSFFIGPGFFESFGLSKLNERNNLDSLLENNRPYDVQFLPSMGGKAIMYNSFDELGSGEDPYTQDRFTSFEVEKKKQQPFTTNNHGAYEKPSENMFTFHTNVQNTHFDPSAHYEHTRVEGTGYLITNIK